MWAFRELVRSLAKMTLGSECFGSVLYLAQVFYAQIVFIWWYHIQSCEAQCL